MHVCVISTYNEGHSKHGNKIMLLLVFKNETIPNILRGHALVTDAIKMKFALLMEYIMLSPPRRVIKIIVLNMDGQKFKYISFPSLSFLFILKTMWCPLRPPSYEHFTIYLIKTYTKKGYFITQKSVKRILIVTLRHTSKTNAREKELKGMRSECRATARLMTKMVISKKSCVILVNWCLLKFLRVFFFR